jgi:hypothetical protein
MEILKYDTHSPKPTGQNKTTCAKHTPTMNWINVPAYELVKQLKKCYTTTCIYHIHIKFATPAT